MRVLTLLAVVSGCIYHGSQRDARLGLAITPMSTPAQETLAPALSQDPAPLVLEEPEPGPDYLLRRMAQVHAQFGQRRPPVSDMHQATLEEQGIQTISFDIYAGVCYTIIGVGAPGVTDLDLFLYNPAGALVGVDQERDNFPVVAYCVPANGTYRLRIVMYAGSGELGVQVFGRTASSSTRPIATR